MKHSLPGGHSLSAQEIDVSMGVQLNFQSICVRVPKYLPIKAYVKKNIFKIITQSKSRDIRVISTFNKRYDSKR